MMEMRERKNRRNNIIMKGIKGEEREKGNKKKQMMREIGMEEKMEDIKEIAKRGSERANRVIVQMRSLKDKKKVMKKKRELTEKGIKMEDDLIWKERKMKWRIEEIAREEREKGNRVWLGYGKIQIEGKWWR